MGDTSINTREETPNTANAEINAPAATSIEILRESKPSENISIDSPTTNEDVEKSEPDPTPVAEKPSNIETVFEKIDINDKSDSNSDSTAGAEGEKEVVSKPEVDLPPLNFDIKEKPPARNKSDIFSQDDKIQSSNTIFSVKGTPSGRINRRREMSSTVFPVGCMGCKEDAPGDALSSPRRFVDAKEAADDPIGHISDTPRKRASSRCVELAAQNLTNGELIDCLMTTNEHTTKFIGHFQLYKVYQNMWAIFRNLKADVKMTLFHRIISKVGEVVLPRSL